MRILGFEWDARNVEKLALHGLVPDDVEALFESGEPAFFGHPAVEGRWIALGFAQAERFVLVVFEHEEETRWVRVVTAYEPTSSRWWKIYGRAKGIEER